MTDAPFPFVVGRGRSGSTLLRAMLDSHPEMAVPPESHFIPFFDGHRTRYEDGGGFAPERFLEDLLRYSRFQRWGLPEEEVREAFAASPPRTVADAVRRAFAVYARHQGKARYGDKTPEYVMHLPTLARLFPEARFVHLVRDGRDVTLSYLDVRFGPSTVAESALLWKRFVREGRVAGRALGADRYLELRYEDLVDDPERELHRICAFVDLRYDDAMLRYFERAEEVVSGVVSRRGHRNIFLPPTSGLRDWRRDMRPRDVAVFEAVAADLLEELGYELGTGRIPGARRLRAGRLRVPAERAALRARKTALRAARALGIRPGGRR